MAHSLSAKKRIRQNARRRALNRARRSALKTKLHKCEETFLRDDPQAAETAVRAASRALDREGSRGTLHPNAVARRKSRLARRLKAAKSRGAASSAT